VPKYIFKKKAPSFWALPLSKKKKSIDPSNPVFNNHEKKILKLKT
jgi:hypothetical protein